MTHIQIRLSDLNSLVSEVVRDNFPSPLWIVAEVASLSVAKGSGHTYLELVEKSGSRTVAQARGNIWNTNRAALLDFERVTRGQLAPGMEVLISAQVTFHAQYGYSLNILAIDPNFTLGDMARRRQQVIDRLTAENLIDRNKQFALPLVPQRIAVISSSTAAGWQDFQKRIAQNRGEYWFDLHLIPALMQGNQAATSICDALAHVDACSQRFDCVVIIRGGGGAVDLHCFDSEPIARAIAGMSLPVVSGIGHERDTSICDMVACYTAATPTAAAELLIQRVEMFEAAMDGLWARASTRARCLLEEQTNCLQLLELRLGISTQGALTRHEQILSRTAGQARNAVNTLLDRHERSLGQLAAFAKPAARAALGLHARALERAGASAGACCLAHMRELGASLAQAERQIAHGAERLLAGAAHALDLAERDVRANDPGRILARGYSITRRAGSTLRSVEDLEPGAQIETILASGRITSRVERTEEVV